MREKVIPNEEPVIDVGAHGHIITLILIDLKDKSFIYSVKDFMNKLRPEDKLNADIVSTGKWLRLILENNILEKKEAIYHLNDIGFSDNLKTQITYKGNYTRAHKNAMLTMLANMLVYTTLEPLIDDASKLLSTIKVHSTSKKGVAAAEDLKRLVGVINKTANNTMVSKESGTVLVIDPIDGNTDNTISSVMENVRTATTNVLKSWPPLDMLVGGGLVSGTLTLFGALSGKFKSGMMLNTTLYMAKNNKKDNLLLDEGMKPIILFISLELTIRQLLERDLQWMGCSLSKEELSNISDKDIEKLLIDHRIKSGIEIPVAYIQRLSGEDGIATPTSVLNIQEDVQRYRNRGFQTVAIVVDYMDRMYVDNAAYRNLSGAASGNESQALLRQKAKELRDLAAGLNVPVITGAQLKGSTIGNTVARSEPYLKMVDPVMSFANNGFAGAAILDTEVDNIVMMHLFEIQKSLPNSNDTEVQGFVSIRSMKSRDGDKGYVKSSRDIKYAFEYQSYTDRLRNENRTIADLIPDSNLYHAVIPFERRFKLHEEDYAESIRKFYPSSRADFLGIDVINMNNENEEDFSLDAI